MSEDKNTFDDCYVEPHAWQKVVKAELQEMDRQSSHRLIGLAMSGGGIRSASFSLGALQAMVAAGRLKDVDYMSTVSGGGYVGSALTWFTNYAGKEGGEPCFGVTAGDFPLGMKEAATLHPAPIYDRGTRIEDYPDEEDPDRIEERTRNQPRIDRLEHIRQHGNYLKPGTVFEFISMIWMILQSMLVPVIVYFLLLFLPLAALAYCLHAILPEPSVLFPLGKLGDALPDHQPIFSWALLLGAGFAIFAVLVLPFVQPIRSQIKQRNGDRTDFLTKQYNLRKRERKGSGYFVLGLLLLFVLGLPPLLNEEQWRHYLPILGSIGLIATFGQLILQIRSVKLFGGRSGGIIIMIACSSLVLGLLWFAYWMIDRIVAWEQGIVFCLDFAKLLGLVALSLLVGFVLGWFQNINLFSLHRLYRDRLMETFLPDFRLSSGDAMPQGPSEPARDANTAFLSTMYTAGNGPYHIINANVVLAGSKEPRHRGRGGNNFILSPLFCGSDATGWRRSAHWKMHAGCMTLPTAMAISGAAINPRTGAVDRSPLREPILSFLMSLTNFRLGLWALNPSVEQDCSCKTKSKIKEKPARPNFLDPGICQGLLPRMHNEDRAFIELTDGAHFDNTGLYELIRRKVKLIIMVDGTADKDINYLSLANALERIRVDFGVQIRFEEKKHNLEGLLPNPKQKTAFVQKYNLAERGYAIARIDYQPHNEVSRDREEDGVLILIKSTMVESLPADVLGYKSAHEDFPNESTADQFFDEVQLEAYRELGYRITKAALNDPKTKEKFDGCLLSRK